MNLKLNIPMPRYDILFMPKVPEAALPAGMLPSLYFDLCTSGNSPTPFE
jgi:hypothetical protein